jgi:hypothetical protein
LGIKEVFKWIIKEIKDPFIFYGSFLTGKPKIRKFTKEEIKEMWDWKGVLKANYLMFLMMVMAFTAGYTNGQIHENNECNKYIYATFIEPNEISFRVIESSKYKFNISFINKSNDGAIYEPTDIINSS